MYLFTLLLWINCAKMMVHFICGHTTSIKSATHPIPNRSARPSCDRASSDCSEWCYSGAASSRFACVRGRVWCDVMRPIISSLWSTCLETIRSHWLLSFCYSNTNRASCSGSLVPILVLPVPPPEHHHRGSLEYWKIRQHWRALGKRNERGSEILNADSYRVFSAFHCLCSVRLSASSETEFKPWRAGLLARWLTGCLGATLF